jgi:hypothetical protein
MRSFGPLNPELHAPTEVPADKDLEDSINAGTAEALTSINNHLENEVMRFRAAMANFQPD